MANLCDKSFLTGRDGKVEYLPAGSDYCFLAASVDATGNIITLGDDHGFVAGDAVYLTTDAGGTLPVLTGVADPTTTKTYVLIPDPMTPSEIQLSATLGGAAIDITSAGTNPTAGGHFHIKLADPIKLIVVREWSFEVTTDILDATTIGTGRFRKKQTNFLDGTGSLTVYFERGSDTQSGRLVNTILAKSQYGATLHLYLDDVVGTPKWIEAPAILTSVSFGAGPEDLQQSTMGFELAGEPTFHGF